ncbi:MAG: gluconate 2-dehydrogenase subunit 3 family protein [Hyphomonas sp.]|nr:gluconate 2-dehydrogenase subunit 3 family protein [Hyphomonas sp.]
MIRHRLPETDRRTTLKWLLAGLGAPPVLAACSPSPTSAGPDLLLGVPKPISGTPYGADPDLMNPVTPWDLTMTSAQKDLVSALVDLVVPSMDGRPSGSALGLQNFVNEWVSSPYEQTQADRENLFAMFEWLERDVRGGGGASFATASEEAQTNALDKIAWSGRVADGLEPQAAAFDRFRNLVVSAYFASEPGGAWLGYIGNQPSMGDYAGPTDEALEHLQSALNDLGLDLPEGL